MMRSGQVMILTVLALGGTLLGATTVAGLLTLYQIRNSTDLANSARAIFAADAGIEWALYNYFCSDTATSTCAAAPPLGEFSNGATVQVTCLDAAGNEPELGCDDSNVTSFRSVGNSGGSVRAFEASF
jgi:threonine/homoserine efflux transporter RhtA